MAFLSNRDGQMDVWVTQVGTGQFYNLTRGAVRELVNPSVRTLGFSPDGALVTFWARGADASNPARSASGRIPTARRRAAALPARRGRIRLVADGARLVYHTPGPGDPMFVRDPVRRTEAQQIFSAPAGLHGHFPVWSPDGAFIYFVQGSLPDAHGHLAHQADRREPPNGSRITTLA